MSLWKKDDRLHRGFHCRILTITKVKKADVKTIISTYFNSICVFLFYPLLQKKGRRYTIWGTAPRNNDFFHNKEGFDVCFLISCLRILLE